MGKSSHCAAALSHTFTAGRRKAERDPRGMGLASARAMTNAARVIKPNPRTLHLVSNQDDRPTEPPEAATDPAGLKPSESPTEAADHSVVVPRVAPLPPDLVAAIRRLPPPNPDSLIEMSIALFMRNLESQSSIDVLLDNAVRRINADAEERRIKATAEISAGFTATQEEVRNLAQNFANLESTVRELVPRISSLEEKYEQLQRDLSTLRSDTVRRVTLLEQELHELQGKPTNPPSFPTMPGSTGKMPRKSNPGK